MCVSRSSIKIIQIHEKNKRADERTGRIEEREEKAMGTGRGAVLS